MNASNTMVHSLYNDIKRTFSKISSFPVKKNLDKERKPAGLKKTYEIYLQSAEE